jgi:hypothetical protein
VYLGAENDLTWKILEHSKAKTDEFEQRQVIGGNQLITIKHTELEAFLCANLCSSDGLLQPYFRKYEGGLAEEKTTVACVDEGGLRVGDRALGQRAAGHGLRGAGAALPSVCCGTSTPERYCT